MKTETIYVLVGKKIRIAQARITPSGVAIIQTTSGPIEPKKWYYTESEAIAGGGVVVSNV